MKTVVLGPRPEELDALIKQRQALGIDGYDEIWEGDYHMAPMARSNHGRVQALLLTVLSPKALAARLYPSGPFNLGAPDNFRVPDGGFFRQPVVELYLTNVAIVVEVLSPDDETYDKFGFYAHHGVDEIIVADPAQRQVRCYELQDMDDHYTEVPGSSLLDVSAADITAAIDWP